VEFSSRTLSASLQLLRIAEPGNWKVSPLNEEFRRVESANANDIFEFAQFCSWISVSNQGHVQITERARTVLSLDSEQSRLREQLADAVCAINPPWARKITLGRFEARKAMPDTAERCFVDCNLFGDTKSDVVQWWDFVGGRMRSNRASVMHKIGRIAELSTLNFEESRVDKTPVWQSIESSVSGYDVLSIADKHDLNLLKVEVKGSTMRLSEAVFSLTRNEWTTATHSDQYHFYLWLLHEQQPKLYVVPHLSVEPFVPSDQRTGRWQIAQMYFRDFKKFEAELPRHVTNFVQEKIVEAS